MPRLMDESRFYKWSESVKRIRRIKLNDWAASHPVLEVGDVVKIKACFGGGIGVVTGFNINSGYSVMLMGGQYRYIYRCHLTKVA